MARWALALFRRGPFLAVWIGTWSPIPDWTIRLLAPMSRYPLGRYLVAMGLGRFPRYWLFAELGRRVGVPGTWLAAALSLSLIVGLVVAWRHRAHASKAGPGTAGPGRQPDHCAHESHRTIHLRGSSVRRTPDLSWRRPIRGLCSIGSPRPLRRPCAPKSAATVRPSSSFPAWQAAPSDGATSRQNSRPVATGS